MEVITAPAKSMYQIRIEHLTIMQMIEDNDGELTEDIEKLLCLTEEEFQDKAISYAFVVKHFDDEAAVIEKEVERLSTKLQQVNKRKEMFKERLSAAMQQFGVEKIDTPTLKLSFRKSSSTEVAENFSEDVLKYFNLSFELNKEAIEKDREALKTEKEEYDNVNAVTDDAAKEKVIELENKLALLAIVPDLKKCFNVKPSFVKTPLTELMKQGVSIPGVSKVEKKNLQIK
jgi:hypothetical protein